MPAIATTPLSVQTTLRLQPVLELSEADTAFCHALWSRILPHIVQSPQGATPAVLQMALNGLKNKAPRLIEQLLLPPRLKHLPYLWQQLGWLACIDVASVSSLKQSYWLPTARGWCIAQQNEYPLSSVRLPQALAMLTPMPAKASAVTQPKVTFTSKAQQRLYQALQQCRAMLAQRHELDPDQICTHKTLLAIVQAHPLSETALAALEGVDARFISQFAPAFLDTLIPFALCP